MKTLKAMILLAACGVLLTSCGGGMSGTYKQSGGLAGGLVNTELTFSGSKVQINTAGVITEGTYELDGKQLKVTRAGQTQIFNIDANGCIDGGEVMGKFCKDK